AVHRSQPRARADPGVRPGVRGGARPGRARDVRRRRRDGGRGVRRAGAAARQELPRRADMTLAVSELIRRKRDGGRLDDADSRAFLRGITDGSVPDYQAAAMLMAIYFRGLDDGELAAWADAMLRSGDVIDLGPIRVPKVDKHSTGGVGDKISLPLAPA